MNGKKYPGLSFHLLLHRISDGDDHALILPWSEKKLEEMYPRTVKKRPTVYTPARMRTARENIRKYPWARRQAQGSIRLAEETIRAPLERLALEMPSPNMPRGWNNPCPHCGWWGHGLPGGMNIVKHPWEAVCPACRKMLPGFDAKSFYFSGRDEWGRFRWDRADQSLLPKDEKFRETALDAFKAYCRNYWSTGFQDAVEVLADAFVFTGKKVYARYAIGLLVHFAYFYPYFLQKDCVTGDTHPGAMLMDCHESMFMKCIALVYDKIFTAIPEPGMIRVADRMVRPYGTRLSTAGEVKAFLEGRIFKIIAGDMKRIWFLDGGITRYRDHVAYETIGMVLGKTPLGRKFQHEAWTLRFQGFEKDGSADVGGLGYDRGAYHRVIGQYFDLMKYCKDARVDYARDSSVQAASHFYFDLYCLDRYFPNYGDARFCSSPARLRPTEQSVPDRRGMSEDMRTAACEYADFFRATGIKRFARIAWHLNGKKTDGIHLGILDRDPEKIQTAIQKIGDKADATLEKSIIARDLGMCVLKSGEGKNRRALWMRANRRNQIHEGGWHGHADSLNLGLFAFGLDIMPDVGFMDQKHWVFGHNTVSRQETPMPHTGQRLPPGWADTALPLPILSEAAFIADLGGGVQVARCGGTQHPGSMRTSFLVDAGGQNFYVVDHFLVSASVPEKYVTYSFHTSQGKVSTDLVLKKNPTSIEGTSRMGGEWIPPAFTAPGKRARGQWWADVKMEDTYGLLNKPCDVRVRFTSLRPADNVFHTWYMPQQKFDGIPKKIPYFFMSLAKPKKRGQPRQFSAIIEPYRKRRAVKSARVIETGRAGVEIIEVEEVSGRTLTFVICPSAGKVTLADGVVTKSDVALVIKAGKEASVHQR